MINNNLIITPKTKVLDLIDTYPELEDLLLAYVPAFEKLKNPLLRRTVAKVATLQQAAIIGNVDISNLINVLRNEIGQDTTMETAENQQYNYTKPEWFNESNVTVQFDVREMLSKGEHPVNQVLADLKALPEGQIYHMIAPFLPVPLIDKATGLNFAHWIDQKEDNLFNIYFSK
ncbi:MAG: DUF1858 domain-containing protein [Paludibacter sp.]|nr:DUF1858 domain-containing protein [Paludibacter sp.]